MEFNFKSNNAYSYMKYGGYQGKYKGKEYYMVPNPEASINIRDLYDMFFFLDGEHILSFHQQIDTNLL